MVSSLRSGRGRGTPVSAPQTAPCREGWLENSSSTNREREYNTQVGGVKADSDGTVSLCAAGSGTLRRTSPPCTAPSARLMQSVYFRHRLLQSSSRSLGDRHVVPGSVDCSR